MERGKQCQTGRSLAYDRSSLKPLQQSQPHTIEHVWSWWMITYTISSKHFNLPSLTTPLLSFNLFWCSDLRRKKQQTLSCSETVCRTLIFVQNVDGTSYLDQAVELRQWFVVNSLWSLGVLWVEFVCVTCMITSLYVVFLCCSRAQERILCSYFPCDYISCYCKGGFCIYINQILNRGKE